MATELTQEQIKDVINNAPEGAEYWTPGYDVEYRKHCMLSGAYIYGYQPDGHWMKAKDQVVAQERIDKGWYLPNLAEKLVKLSGASTIIEACEGVFGTEGEFHVFEIHAAKAIHIMVTSNNVEFAGKIAEKFDKYDGETKVMVRVVPNLTKAVEDLYPVHEPFLAQQIGRALRKPEPKEGEVWYCELREGGKGMDIHLTYINEKIGFMLPSGVDNIFSKHADITPVRRMYTQEDFDAKSNECQEHADAVTKLSEGLSIITDACKERGLGDRPYVDIVQLLLEAERKIIEPKIYDAPALYPLVEDAYYMCKFEFKGGTATEPLKWRGGGWFFGEKPLSQTTNNPEPLYRMVKLEPKEQVLLQLDGLPPIGSEVYKVPSRKAGNGKPGLVATNPGRKVCIYAHFTDSRGVDLAAYVTCDDKHPYVGGVACATAFETEEQKTERQVEIMADDLKEFDVVSIGELKFARRMHAKGYYKGDNND
ncbi:hypothetical protein VPHD81_0104 [Vibrio phage D81]